MRIKSYTKRLRISRLRAAYVLVLLFSWWGLLGNIISNKIGGIAYFAISVLIMMLAFYPGEVKIRSEKRKLMRSIVSFIVFSLLYAVLSLLLLHTAHNTELLGITIPVYTYNTIINLPIWIGCGIVVLRSYDLDYKMLLNVLFWVLLYNIVVTLAALGIDPNYARNASAGIIDPSMVSYQLLGAMGYELSYSIAMLIPLMFILGKRGDKKWYLIAIIGVFFVIKSGFFIGIVAMLLNIALSLVLGIKKRNMRYVLTILMVIAAILLIVNLPFVGSLMISLSSKMESGDLQRRIKQVGVLLAYQDGTGDSLIRFKLYQKSLNGIVGSPILGQLIINNNFSLSDHSTILDVWGGFGLIPLALLIYSFIKALDYSKTKVRNKSTSNIITAAFLTVFFIGLLNQLFVSPLLMLVPFMAIPMISSVVGKMEMNCLRGDIQ